MSAPDLRVVIPAPGVQGARSPVLIHIANPKLLKPGMTATVHIVVDRRNEVLRVPAAALRYLPGGLPAASGAARGQLEAAARVRRPTS